MERAMGPEPRLAPAHPQEFGQVMGQRGLVSTTGASISTQQKAVDLAMGKYEDRCSPPAISWTRG